jgi:hypothetical protein
MRTKWLMRSRGDNDGLMSHVCFSVKINLLINEQAMDWEAQLGMISA